jgi:putative membrane protein
MSTQVKAKQGPLLFLSYVISGILIGGGAILPGVSGGVLAVIFGIYRPMMELFSHPIKALKKHLSLFIPVGIGVAIGFVGFAKVLGTLFEKYEIQTLWGFVGIIFGTVPMLLKTAREETGKTQKADLVALVGSFGTLLAVLVLLNTGQGINMTLTPATAFLSGIIWGLSLIVPGLSSSSLLIFMGLYDHIMSAVGALNFSVIVPLLLGIALVAALCARAVEKLFQKHFSYASHAVVGLVLASTLTIIPRPITVWGLALAAIGFVLAALLDRWQASIQRD